MSEPERRVDFEALNLFGKALYVGGSAVRVIANVIDGVIDRAVDVVLDAEKSFRQGLDPNIEDAKILQEITRHRSRSRREKRDTTDRAEKEDENSSG